MSSPLKAQQEGHPFGKRGGENGVEWFSGTMKVLLIAAALVGVGVAVAEATPSASNGCDSVLSLRGGPIETSHYETLFTIR